jgi:CRISPR-associated protein Csb2
MPCLLISLRFHDGRYHGWPEWPPSPARLFQALVAGAAQGDTLASEDRLALAWLESLQAPVIAAPPIRAGKGFNTFVPNNDLDSVGGEPERIPEIRTPKFIRPLLFDATLPLLYVWRIDEVHETRTNAHRICTVAERVYQLGRGVDMAWASGELLATEETEARLGGHGGAIYQPCSNAGGTTLATPVIGSLGSLIERYRETRGRFHINHEVGTSKKGPDRKLVAGQIFVQPRKPRFLQVAYDSPPLRLLFDLVGERIPWRLDRVIELTERVRDAAAEKL